ncbi:MAG: fumarylacetoacetate hydrolase family protein [Pseudomonadota bacterium]
MKYQLFTYAGQDGTPKSGIAVADKLYDLASVADGDASAAIRSGTIDDMLTDWPASHRMLARIADATGASAPVLSADSITFLAPLTRPGVIYAAGANYRDHVEAMGKAMNMKLSLDPRSEGIDPWHFIKAGKGTLAGHREVVPFPGHTQKLDWEAELAVVIGRKASKVSKEDALEYVAGYTCANDLSARDNLVRQQVDPGSPFRFDWIGHKSFAGACPLGPFLTPAEFVGSPEELDIKLWLNGELKQDSNTSNHLYGVADHIAYLSQRLDLYPGDVVLTGTPAGVGMETGNFLKRGDVMRVWINGLGDLETTIA